MKKADLSPPLGFPGGPCYVSDRAEDIPKSKAIQQSLERKGDIPKNLERDIYPDRHIQKGRGKFDLALSSHAQYRMDLRGISVPILTKAFMSFEKWFLDIVENRKKSSKGAKRFNALLEDMRQRKGFTWQDKRTGIVLAIHYRTDLPTDTFLIATAYFKNIKDPRAPGKGSCSLKRSDPVDQAPKDDLLRLLTRRPIRKSYQQPASELAGVRTFVDEKSDKGIADSGSSSSYLPSDSPKSDKYRAKPLPSTHSKSRDKHIPQPAYNAPGSSQDGNAIKVRTPSTPGAQYGHPYIDQGTSLHKRRTMQAAVEPHQKIQAIVDQLYKKGVIDDPIQVRYYGPIGSGDVQIQLFTSSGRVGFFFTDRIAYGWDPISGLPLNPECKKAFRKIKKRSPDLELWSLEASNLKDKRLWNKGIGKLAYEQILKDAGSYGAAVVPHWCRKGGSTSGMAQRVWDSLKRRYESEGPIVIPKTLRLASPQRVASFYYHQYSSEDYKSEGAEDKGLPSAYSPTNRYPNFDEDHPATKMNNIRSIDGGPRNVPSIEKVRDRYARRLLR